MKISDFSIIPRRSLVAGGSGETVEWVNGSGGTLIATGEYRGKRYQIKVRASKPRWFDTDGAIEDKNRQIRECLDDDEKARLQSSLETLKSNKAKNDEADRLNDLFLEAKNKFFTKINGIKRPEIYSCSKTIWKEPIPMKGNGIYCVEAAPWLNLAMGFDSGDGKPLYFKGLDKAKKYGIISSLCSNLACLHDEGVIHGDLKIGNTVIVESEGKYQSALIDFDAAYILKDLHQKKYPQSVWEKIVGGTYFAPEVLPLREIIVDGTKDEFEETDFTPITFKADIFALGFTIWEYFFGSIQNQDNPIKFVAPEGNEIECPFDFYGQAIGDGCKPVFPKDTSEEFDDLLYGMLNWMLDKEPENRPDAKTCAKIFESGDLSQIPSRYKRIDLSLPDENDRIRFTDTPNCAIMRILSKPGYYRVTRGGVSVNYSVKRLLEEGLAVSLDGSHPAPRVDEPKTAWLSDGIGEVALPACIRRKPGADGKYLLKGVFSETEKDMAQLKEMGFFCPAEKIHTFWPSDVLSNPNVYLKERIIVTRNFDLGPGHYFVETERAVGKGFKTKIKYSALVTSGYAVTTQNKASETVFLTTPREVDKIVFIKENIPNTIQSIVKSPMNGLYIVSYKDGTKPKENWSVQKLIDSNFAKSI